MKRHEIKYYVFIICLISGYLYAIHYIVEMPAFPTVVTNILALISAVTFWMQLKRAENLNEANYIMNLNQHFINNKDIIAVEQALTVYFAEGREAGSYEKVKLNLDLNLRSDDRQRLINYLVHLEAMAAIFQRGVMHLDVVDDLFAYRFFIAVNNPEVQKAELIPYQDFYQGCFTISKMWTKKMRAQGREIPMDDTALCDTPAAMNMQKGVFKVS